jgi:serine/threonine protein kinase
MELSPIPQLGKYHLIRYLAHGGMSDIYLARDENDEQLYALKLVRREIANNYRHFHREVAILQKLKHEHILPLMDAYEGEDGTAYYITPYIQQGSLRERLSSGPLSPAEATAILCQVGEALQFIHDLGLIHRDIKPANILLNESGHAWLADFGLAKDANVPSDLTDSGCLIGTPYYLAPELLKEPASKSSDIYALGVVLYEMLTGTPPFTGQTLLAICWKHVDELPPPPSTLNPLISEAVEQVILRALAKQPEERYASVREFVEAYQEALLSPTTVLQLRDERFDTMPPEILELADTVARERAGAQTGRGRQSQKHSLVAALTLLALFFVLGAGSLTFALQTQSASSINANAQMISLPGHTATAPSTTPSLTDRPNAKVTPTPRQNNQGNGAQQTGSQGNGPAKSHKHKHKHGKDGDD